MERFNYTMEEWFYKVSEEYDLELYDAMYKIMRGLPKENIRLEEFEKMGVRLQIMVIENILGIL